VHYIVTFVLASHLPKQVSEIELKFLTQTAEWSQSAVDYFLANKITALRNEITLKAPPGEWTYK